MLAAFVRGVGEAWHAFSSLLQDLGHQFAVFEFMFAEQILEVLISTEA